MAKGPSTLIDPYLIASEDNVRFTSIIASGELLPDGTYFGGIPDGIGAFDNGDGTITVLVNHELSNTSGVPRDHGSAGAYIDRLVIDKDTLEIISSGDLIQSVVLSTGTSAFNRFCSGDLADSTAFKFGALGTDVRIYMTGEETAEGRATGTLVSGANAGTLYELGALGNMAFENLVANPYAQAKTIVAETDDSNPLGQVYIYVGTKQSTGTEVEKAGLTNGLMYGIKVSGLPTETNATAASGNFTLEAVGADGNVNALTAAQIDAASIADGITNFLRPEDFAWDPENPNVAYFVTTASFTGTSRLYKLTFSDITNPTAGGTIEAVAETTAENGGHMFDNIAVENGKVVIQEDPGNNPYLARIWEYDILNGTLTEQAQFDPAHFVSGAPGFLTGDEESSGVIDVTDLLGDNDTRAYLLDAQIHKAFADPDLTTPGNEVVEYGQLLVMYVDDPAPTGTRQADFLRGNSNNQTINANNGDDTIWAFGGNDVVFGGNGVDAIHGGSGSDTLSGDNGNDLLFGDLGNDTLSGGRGSDDFIFNNTNFGNGADAIIDFAGGDRILTTSELDSDGGVVDFGTDNDLDLFDGGSVTINGGDVDHLIALGTVEIAGTTYYAYGLHG